MAADTNADAPIFPGQRRRFLPGSGQEGTFTIYNQVWNYGQGTADNWWLNTYSEPVPWVVAHIDGFNVPADTDEIVVHGKRYVLATGGAS